MVLVMQILANKFSCRVLLISLMMTGTVLAASIGEILKDDIVSEADAEVLMGEANLFETIRKGIALSIALCTDIEDCVPSVNRQELERIIGTLDTRISSLSQRHEETGDTELEQILISYADTREAYSQFIEIIGTFSTGEEVFDPEATFGDEDFLGEEQEAVGFDEQFDVFSDSEDDLEDDIEEDEEVDDLGQVEDDSGMEEIE